MTAHLQPKPGFNWMAVCWGGPEEPRTERCSYCEAKLPDITDDEYAVPLIIWNEDGWCAEFCAVCQQQWWGLNE